MRTLWPQMFPAQVLPDLQRDGLVRQRSLSNDLIFCYLLYQDKIATAIMSTYKKQTTTNN
jgi:hypothetical protein